MTHRLRCNLGFRCNLGLSFYYIKWPSYIRTFVHSYIRTFVQYQRAMTKMSKTDEIAFRSYGSKVLTGLNKEKVSNTSSIIILHRSLHTPSHYQMRRIGEYLVMITDLYIYEQPLLMHSLSFLSLNSSLFLHAHRSLTFPSNFSIQ